MHLHSHSLRGVLLALFSAGAVLATTVHGPADIATLTRAADVVVRARVVSMQSHWGAGGEKSGLIFTTVELAPSEQWKGEPVGDRIAVRKPGGEVSDLAQQVIGSGTFEPGEDVVLFLRLRAKGSGAGSKTDPTAGLDIYEVTRWALGKFSVVPAGAASPAHAMRNRAGVECIGCGPAEEDDLSLDELRARVRGAVANPLPAPGKAAR